MAWSTRDPGAGDPGGMRHGAQVRSTLADSISQTAVVALQSVVDAQGTAAWTGVSASTFFETAAGFLPEVAVILGGLENDSAALYAYATEVESIKNDAVALDSNETQVTSDLYRWQHKLTSLESTGFLMVDPAELAENRQEQQRYEGLIQGANWTLRDIGRQWDALASRRVSADSACVARLTSSTSRGALSGFDGGGSLSDAALLESLSGLSATELAILLKQHPEVADQIAAVDDPALVAAWWAGYSDPKKPGIPTAAQLLLISTIPQTIGNLNGVPLASRVEANKLNIAAAKEQLGYELMAVLATEGLTGKDLSADAEALRAQIAYYDDLLTETMTFWDADGQPVTITGHNIVYFDAGADAIAEYSGLFDPATGGVPGYVQNLGIYIPGMNSTIMSFESEVKRSEWFVNEHPGSVAMITWKGGAFPDITGVASGPNAAELGGKLEHFSHSLYGMPDTVEVVGMGYSFGGAVLGNAEAAGLTLARSIEIAGAGMGDNVTSLDDYPNSADVPHYSFMAPDDYVVGPIQGIDLGDLGHGPSPVSLPGVIRLETGWNEARNQDSGQVTGHGDMWLVDSTAHNQMDQVLIGGTVELYAKPDLLFVDPYTGTPIFDNPVMTPGYTPVLAEVPGGMPEEP